MSLSWIESDCQTSSVFLLLQKQVLAKLVGKPDASDSELHSVVFEKVGKDPARMQAIKE